MARADTQTGHPVHGADSNPDPITGEPGAHPVGVGFGTAVGGAAAGAAAGAMAGPVGTVAGAVIGGVAGGLAGKGIAESIDPTAEDAYWRENYANRSYYDQGTTLRRLRAGLPARLGVAVPVPRPHVGPGRVRHPEGLGVGQGQLAPDLGEGQARDPRRLGPGQPLDVRQRIEHDRPRRPLSGAARDDRPGRTWTNTGRGPAELIRPGPRPSS